MTSVVLDCHWFDISKSHILVHCWFGYLRYQCRSVVLDTAELPGILYKSSGRWGSLVYYCIADNILFKKSVQNFTSFTMAPKFIPRNV